MAIEVTEEQVREVLSRDKAYSRDDIICRVISKYHGRTDLSAETLQMATEMTLTVLDAVWSLINKGIANFTPRREVILVTEENEHGQDSVQA